MELQDEELAEKDCEELSVDLSKQTLKRIERAITEQKSAVTLILDHNEIQRLENLETYPNLKKLSVVNNQLVRMYGVSPLVNLVTLDISHNSLVTIEGLKDLKELKYLNLAKNRIKSIEHLNGNLKLEKIDLSENNIMRISDISFLENLKELNLHGNRINLLSQCEKKLPKNLGILTLNNNSLSDLNEVSHLVHLTSLKELTITNNPCLDFSEDQKFNYRPFVKNWCSSVIVLDNRPLDDIECLKAEWLYSQGRGRSFKPGEHAALIEYLISVCPREAEENAETEDVKKLKLILSKAHLHQQQLREQLSKGNFKSPLLKKKTTALPDRMVTSFQDPPSKELRQSPDLMARSLDSGMMKTSFSRVSKPELNQTALQTSTTFIPIPDTLISPDVNQPVGGTYPKPSSISSQTSRSSSRNSQHFLPENKRKSSGFRRQSEGSSPFGLKMHDKQNISRISTPFDLNTSPNKTVYSKNNESPVRKGTKSKGSERNCRETSEEEDSEVLAFKIKAIQQRVSQRRLNKTKQTDKEGGSVEKKEKLLKNVEKDFINRETWKAAVCIQRWWRGYRARNLNGEVLTGCKNIQMSRMQDYILKVVNDMEATRVALEGNKKLVVLQMQAINALWKKMTALQPAVSSESTDNKACLQNLVETCSALNKQVEGIQAIMKTMTSSGSAAAIPMATQTDIVAVHTPQGEGKEIFPFDQKIKSQFSDVKQYVCDSFEEKGNSLKESDSNDISTMSSVKTVTELYTNSNIHDTSEVSSWSESFSEKDASILSETLKKPTVKLNENNLEVSQPASQSELEKSEDSKFENCES